MGKKKVRRRRLEEEEEQEEEEEEEEKEEEEVCFVFQFCESRKLNDKFLLLHCENCNYI